MSKHTVVLSFEDGKEPAYHAGMRVLSGTVEAVQFSDALEEMQLLEEQRDDLLEALEAMVFGAAAVAVHHEGERKALQTAVDIAIAAIAKARGEE